MTGHSRSSRGYTLVEMLMVVSTIGVILSLLLPAIFSARQKSVALQCKNNLRQLALAAQLLATTQNHFPSGGWGGGWIGIPGRGVGRMQPGGWAYGLLPYLERNDLADLGRDQSGKQQRAALSKLLQTSVPMFNCPARRQPMAYPIFYGFARRPHGANPVKSAVRGDYAANAGDQRMCEAAHYGGPRSLDLNYLRNFRWPDMSGHTGVVFLGSEITFAHLRDGAGRTYLFGEKYMSASNYTTGVDHGDDWNLYAGYQDDVCRTAFFPIQRDAGVLGGRRGCCGFGGPHASGWHVAFCDASVRSFNWKLSPRVHKSLANRADGLVIDDSLLKN